MKTWKLKGLTQQGLALGVGLGAALSVSNGPAVGITIGAAFAVVFSQVRRRG